MNDIYVILFIALACGAAFKAGDAIMDLIICLFKIGHLEIKKRKLLKRQE